MNIKPQWSSVIVFFMLIYQILWMITVLQLPDYLTNQISLSVPIEVIVSVAIVMFLAFTLRALIFNRAEAMRYTIMSMMMISVTIIIRIVLFAEADYDRQRLPFLCTGITLIYGLALLPKILRYIHKSTKGEKTYDPNP